MNIEKLCYRTFSLIISLFLCIIIFLNIKVKDISTPEFIQIEQNLNISDKVNINTASLDELLKLNGIGETLANRIIEYRQKYTFKTIEDIKNVKGIKDSIFAKIKDYIEI